MIEVRKLTAVDMAWLGTRVIVTEYALGVMLPLGLGIVSLCAALARQDLANWQTILGAPRPEFDLHSMGGQQPQRVQFGSCIGFAYPGVGYP